MTERQLEKPGAKLYGIHICSFIKFGLGVVEKWLRTDGRTDGRTDRRSGAYEKIQNENYRGKELDQILYCNLLELAPLYD